MEDLPTAGAFQSYASHRRYLPGWHFFAIPVLGFQAVLALRTLVSLPSLATAGAFVVAVALVVGLVLSRRMALRVQDRLIRLEERLRLQRLLPPERHPEIDRLGLRQLIALRFASDAEVPHLFGLIVEGGLTSPDDIKRDVQHWRADHLRA